MISRSLIHRFRNLSVGCCRQYSAAIRGNSGNVSPSQAFLQLTHTPLPVSTEVHDKSKAHELSLTVKYAQSLNRDVVIKTPGFSKSNIIIGHVPGNNTTAILDPSTSPTVIGDVVPDKISDLVGDNPHTAYKQPEYHARHIQKIRRWMMNRHKLIKWRKRNKTKLIRKSFLKTKKKLMKSEAICKAIRQDGEQFDALQFVKERLALAKTGGYVQNIWKDIDDQPPVPWKAYTTSKTKIKTYVAKEKPPRFPTQKEISAARKAAKKKRQQT